jgi:hypothetical protein
VNSFARKEEGPRAAGGDFGAWWVNWQRLLEPLAGLDALAAAVTFGLNRCFTFGRDNDFDNAGHQDFSNWAIFRSKRTMHWCCFWTVLNARFNLVCHRANVARSRSRRWRSF